MRTLAAMLAIVTLGVRVGAQERPRSRDDFLTRDIGLSAAELSALARGAVVGKVLPTGDRRDVALVGAVQVNAARSAIVNGQHGFPRAMGAKDDGPAHLFGDPATVDDMRALAVTAEDLNRFRNCRANSCDFKIPATDMNHLRENIDWSRPDARARVEAYARQRIVDLVTDYRRLGNAAMVVYDDRGSVHAGDAFVAMLRDSSLIFRIAPLLAQHLLDAPRDTLRDATEAIYWSVNEMPGVRQTLRVMHEIVYSPPETPGTTIVAAKQIFADHYFEAGLEVLTVVDRSGGEASPSAGVTVIAVRRYRFDNLPNAWPLNIRGRVVNGLRGQMVDGLARLRAEYEGRRRRPGGRR